MRLCGGRFRFFRECRRAFLPFLRYFHANFVLGKFYLDFTALILLSGLAFFQFCDMMGAYSRAFGRGTAKKPHFLLAGPALRRAGRPAAGQEEL